MLLKSNLQHIIMPNNIKNENIIVIMLEIVNNENNLLMDSVQKCKTLLLSITRIIKM